MTSPATDSRLEPLTELSAWFADRHAKDQETIADNLLLAFFPLWQLMRFTELDASTAPFVQAALPVIERSFLQSQRLSVALNANIRFSEMALEIPLLFDFPDVDRPQGVGVDSFRVPRVGLPASPSAPKQQRITLQRFDPRDVAKSLVIEANYMTKRAMPGTEEEVMRAASVRTAGTAVREALNGARGVTDNVVRIDRRVKGYARVTDSDPCPFCALLASRGAEYGRGSFIKSDDGFVPHPDASDDVPQGWTNVAKVHNNCRCQLRPVYTVAGGMDAAANHYKNLWDDVDVKQGLEGYAKKRSEINQYTALLKANPFEGNQFELNGIRKSVEQRAIGLLDAGLPPNDVRVIWANDTARQLASAA